MVVGVTGSREIPSAEQVENLTAVLDFLFEPNTFQELHHGDCVGCDLVAVIKAEKIGYLVIAHPPIDGRYRAFYRGSDAFPPKEYLDRNKDIVDACDVLVAMPRTHKEELRSGTWSTVRYARKTDTPVVLVHGDGIIVED